MKLRKDDVVRVIRGKDRGKEGKILHVLPAANKVVVDGLNIAKRHTARRSDKDKSEIKMIPMPMPAANVMLVHKGKVTRVGYKVDAKGNKVRIARSTGDEI
ncbi:MAG: 50S ribosomal protein L24 [Actinobacteria bacterium]|jgi:large subunit ribosomal protein L24|nr:50S ribosomal protein L24 [Actinomycetota bacterium]NBO80135.1 50S ribosomal protein L24 [Actinomycetota bacterium]NBP17117.1 50S ribosomal protein L24 [Actinomycetota bacterium]NBR75820.1 50S ribosomal protein L24 [Actinomycetota bacterium]NBY57979.1 50S ribosomal protein L24 [Actinomycetota bacterium]